jgi:hypothetical protein
MGARISTGKNNKQDYATPADFMAAVTKRFGPIAFDLAAHASNAKSPNYFAPVTGREGPLPFDSKAFGMDAFDHPWAKLSCETFFDPHHEVTVRSEIPTIRWTGPGPAVGYLSLKKETVSRPCKGLLWLNCEFNDIPRWVTRVKEEAEKGADILSLTPASVGSVWFDDLVAPFANVYLLRPRISFIPGEPYNKDCMLAHFKDPRDLAEDEMFPFICTWDWKRDKITHLWQYQEKLDGITIR